MERAGGNSEAGAAAGAAGAAAAAAAGGRGELTTARGRTCKGCLYYSSVLRSRSRGPVCVGISRSVPKVPDRLVGEIELEAYREGRNLSNFRYACAGYSLFVEDGKVDPTGKGNRRAQLPVCLGLELLQDRKAPKQAPAQIRKEGQQAPQPRQYKHAHGGEDFSTKFRRNAVLVANGVARNLNKVGAYIKDTKMQFSRQWRERD